MIITIIGFGFSGQKFLSEIIASNTPTITQINLVDKRGITESEVPRLSLPIKIKRFERVEDLALAKELLGVTILAVSPYDMEEILKLLSCTTMEALIVEKPGPIPFSSGYQILSAIERAGCNVYISHQRQYAKHFKWVSQVVAKGGLGEIDCGIVSLGKLDYLTAGTHWAALCHELFGRPVSVRGQVTSLGETSWKYGYPIEQDARFHVFHETGSEVVWRLGLEQRSDLRIVGKQGILDVKYHEGVLAKHITCTGCEDYIDYSFPRVQIILAANLQSTPIIGCGINDLVLYLATFEAACRSTKTGGTILLSDIDVETISLEKSLISLAISSNN